MNDVILKEDFENLVVMLRGLPVIIDRSIARFYEVTVSELNYNVRENPDLFPEDFAFETTKEEKKYLIGLGGDFAKLKYSPHNPMAYTQRGAYMLPTVMRTDKAKKIHVQIIRLFDELVKEKFKTSIDLNEILLDLQHRLSKLEQKDDWNDERFEAVFSKLYQDSKNKIGF